MYYVSQSCGTQNAYGHNEICDRACDNRTCGHMIFAYFFHNFIIHNVLYHYAMELKFSALRKHRIGIMMQVTEWKYTFSVLRYDL